MKGMGMGQEPISYGDDMELVRDVIAGNVDKSWLDESGRLAIEQRERIWRAACAAGAARIIRMKRQVRFWQAWAACAWGALALLLLTGAIQ